MAKLLANIHSTSTANLPTLPLRIDPLNEVVDHLTKYPQWNDLCEYLLTLSDVRYKGSPTLLHGDFWPENLLWQRGIIRSVLDWEDAALGDPISDVACCQLELRYKFGVAGMQQFALAYAQHRCIDNSRLAQWLVYVAANALRFMGDWNLEKTTEAHMRNEALLTIREAEAVLIRNKTQL